MTAPDALRMLLQALDTHGIPYMLVGALSVNQYAAPQSTDDADITVEASSDQLARVGESLGSVVVMDRQLTFETATGTKRTIFKVAQTNYRIEMFFVSADAHDQQRFARRVEGRLGDLKVWVPTAEDVVIWKLRWAIAEHRAKDEEDVRNILATQGASLDVDYIRGWCQTHQTLQLLEDLLGSLPKRFR